MEQTGIVRRVDELGRIVIPKAIREMVFKTKSIEGKPLEIYVNGNDIILREYDEFTTIMSDGVTECCGYDFGADAFGNIKPICCPMCGRKIISHVEEKQLRVRKMKRDEQDVVAWASSIGILYLKLHDSCAIKTKKGLCIMGKITHIGDIDMNILTGEIGEIIIKYCDVKDVFEITY